MKKIVISNILIFLFLTLVFEVLCFIKTNMEYIPVIEEQSKISDNPEEYKKSALFKYFFPEILNWKDRIYRIEGKSSKRPVIAIGCSYTKGVGLDSKQILSYKINKLTARTVYNIALEGSGTAFVLDTLQDKSLINEVPDAEYIIYTFIYDHIRRNCTPYVHYLSTELIPFFKLKNNTLIQEKYKFSILYSSYIVKKYYEQNSHICYNKEKNTNLQLLMKLLEESVYQMKSKYPNAKFILLEFPQGHMDREDYVKNESELTEEQIKMIEALDVKYINAEKLAGHEYRDTNKWRLQDKDHPKEIVWEELAPLIVKELNL